VPFEIAGAPHPNGNWSRSFTTCGVFEGFLPFLLTGDASTVGPGSPTEVMYWSLPSRIVGEDLVLIWCNSVEGVRLANGAIDGVWASTDGYSGSAPQTDVLHFTLRAPDPGWPIMDMQSLRLASLSSGTVAVLGCPGGRVRVISGRGYRVDNSNAHARGTMQTSPTDLGHGGVALAVRPEGSGSNELVRIWFGTSYGHAPLPAAYATSGSLQDSEVLCGGIHTMTWSASSGFSGATTVSLRPGSPAGSGFGVVGLAVANLLPESVHAGEELIATTLSGDLLIFEPMLTSSTPIWRTNVTGSIGCYNSIIVDDLDGDGLQELYLAGSQGIWRFVLPGE
jgi:hypothetical protein